MFLFRIDSLLDVFISDLSEFVIAEAVEGWFIRSKIFSTRAEFTNGTLNLESLY